jgi:protein-S-isoprenylcysteine O-methyltransferase Ste14
LALALAYVIAGFGWRTVIQARRTGDTGFRGVSGRPGSPHWWAGVLFILAVTATVLGPVAAILGMAPVAALTAPGLAGLGLVLVAVGAGGTLLAQRQMGMSWRIGVDEQERTQLVTKGLFARVRNPIFTAVLTTGLGLALLVPNPVALLGFAGLVLGAQVQVRVVEEPYLIRTHGPAYRDYAATTGRFLPWIGRLKRG